MKIAITSSGRDLQGDIDSRFGRCPNFIIYDTDNGQFEAVENSNIGGMGGVGVQSAQLMINKGVKVLITGSCGPNAFSTLSAAGIKIVTGASGKVEVAIEEYLKGNLKNVDKPNSAPHSGLGPR